MGVSTHASCTQMRNTGPVMQVKQVYMPRLFVLQLQLFAV